MGLFLFTRASFSLAVQYLLHRTFVITTSGMDEQYILHSQMTMS